MSETVDATNKDVRSASQMLSEARNALGLSQEEVAQELFLIPSYIRHIDSDEIDKIDKQAFVRGYLRSYAKLVNLDGDDMVARYEQSQGVEPQKIEIRGVTQEPVGSTNFTGPVIQTAIMGLIGFILVVSLVWFLVSSGEEEPTPVVTGSSAPAANVVEEEAPVLSEEPVFEEMAAEELVEGPAVDEVIEETTEQPAAAIAEAEIEVATTEREVPDESALEEEPVAEAVQAPAVTSEEVDSNDTSISSKEISFDRIDGVIYVDAGGSDELRFSFTDECWVEIEDGEGHAIYGDLNRSGDELVVSGAGPFEVLFGKAPAVTMSFNGEPFDLTPHTTSVDTAKVKVGN